MQNGLLNLNWTTVLNGVVTAVVVAVLGYIAMIGNVFVLDFHTIINTAVMSGIGAFLVSLGTTTQGNFVGLLSVRKPTKITS
jgi:hypothetical protein